MNDNRFTSPSGDGAHSARLVAQDYQERTNNIMSRQNRVPWGYVAWYWFAFAAMSVFAVSGVRAADSMCSDEVKAHWRQQREKIKSIELD